MKIVYSAHLKRRLKERKIPQSYPREIISNPEQEYIDNITNYRISVKKLFYAEKIRSMVVAYDIIESGIEVITIHPISDSEIKNKVKAGRWKKYEKN